MLKKVVQKTISRLSRSALMAYTILCGAAIGLPVYAADDKGKEDEYAWVEKLSVEVGTDATYVVEYILGVLMKVCELFGGVIMLWGIVNWVMAMKNEDAGSKQKAIMATITGILLFTFRSILKGAGIILA